MMKKFKRFMGIAMAGAMASMMAVGSVQAEGKKLRVGWTAWSDAEAVTKIAKQLLEQRLGYEVELVLADIGLQYQGLATGDLDVMLMSWLPTTHAAYWDKVGDKVEDLGKLYGPARLGWVVPAYVPESEVKTIADLNKPGIRKKFKKTIQGIDPGAGLMQASERTVKAYDLKGYNLVSASGAGMTAAVGRAVKRNEWIAATTWSPHWMFARWDLRYLDDPKQELGGEEFIHALGRKGFSNDFPKAAKFIANFKMPMSDLEGIMLRATDTSYEKEVDDYIKANGDKVDAWLKAAEM